MPLETYVQSSTDLATIVCGNCSGIYAIAERYRKYKEDRGGYWHCPYCQCSWGYGISTVSKLEKEIANAKRQVDHERKLKEWAQQETRTVERRRRSLKGQITKFKKRVGNGVCPCCNRSFENLKNHMHSQHPNYIEKG